MAVALDDGNVLDGVIDRHLWTINHSDRVANYFRALLNTLRSPR